jgi:hypothetical protein
MEPKYGPWFNVKFCSICCRYLTNTEVMYSEGRCPKCGLKDHKSATIVEHYDAGVRRVITKEYPWWMFWKNDEYHYEILDDNGEPQPWEFKDD